MVVSLLKHGIGDDQIEFRAGVEQANTVAIHSANIVPPNYVTPDTVVSSDCYVAVYIELWIVWDADSDGVGVYEHDLWVHVNECDNVGVCYVAVYIEMWTVGCWQRQCGGLWTWPVSALWITVTMWVSVM